MTFLTLIFVPIYPVQNRICIIIYLFILKLTVLYRFFAGEKIKRYVFNISDKKERFQIKDPDGYIGTNLKISLGVFF